MTIIMTIIVSLLSLVTYGFYRDVSRIISYCFVINATRIKK